MTILLLEPQFHSLSGHYNRYARVIAREARTRGQRVKVAASKEISKEAVATLAALDIEVKPVFPKTSYYLNRNRAGQSQSTDQILAAALGIFHKSQTTRFAWLSGIPSIIEAISLFAQEVRGAFPFQLIDFARDWDAGNVSAPLQVRHSLKRAMNSGATLYAQTEFIARVAQQECGISFEPFPPILDFKPARTGALGEKPHVGLMNILLDYKDAEAAFDALEKNANRLHISVHCGIYSNERRRLLKPRCEAIGASFYAGALSHDQYNQVWGNLDALLLPYDHGKYSRQGSGMLFECLSDGIIPIVPAGTSMAALASEKGVGIVYDSADPAALPLAVETLIERFKDLAEASRAVAPLWRAENSPSRVFECLERAWAR